MYVFLGMLMSMEQTRAASHRVEEARPRLASFSLLAGGGREQKEKLKSSPAAAQSSAVSARRMLDPTAFRMASGESARCLLLPLIVRLAAQRPPN